MRHRYWWGGTASRPEWVGVARLIQEITGVMPREGVAAAVHRDTEGNPLFVGEVARLLAAEGGLERAGDPAGLGLAVPEGIREVIGRRAARLPEPCGRVLGLAAMFGREFWLPRWNGFAVWAAREELRRAADIARRCEMAEELSQAALVYAGHTFERGASRRPRNRGTAPARRP